MNPSTTDTDSLPPRRVRNIAWWQYALLLPLVGVFRLWVASLRLEVDGEALAKVKLAGPSVFAFWHNRLFTASELYYRYRKVGHRQVFGLVSASRDGAWLAAFYQLVGIGVVRGSSSWRGRVALNELSEVMADGHDVAITPDGPRGPCYDFKSGAAVVASRARASLFLITVNYQRAWRLNSWDGFYLPLPFSRAQIHVTDATDAAHTHDGDHVQLARKLRELLLQQTHDPCAQMG